MLTVNIPERRQLNKVDLFSGFVVNFEPNCMHKSRYLLSTKTFEENLIIELTKLLEINYFSHIRFVCQKSIEVTLIVYILL